MTAVSEARLKGNYGAAIVSARLSAECLVRPVAADTDIGVDLYCETIADGLPFLHFWVQVKAGSQCALSESTPPGATCRFDRDHLAYWRRQPVPVFAALVPTDWPVTVEPAIYVVDITTQVLDLDLHTDQASFRLASNYHWPAGSPSAVRLFLDEIVPATAACLQVSSGVLAPIPTLVPQYVRKTPKVPVVRFLPAILDQLRTTAAKAALQAFAESLEPEALAAGRLLAGIAEQFGDDPHWENFMARALSCHAHGEYEQASNLYAKSIAVIHNDAVVRDRVDWRDRVRAIDRLRSAADARQPLGQSA